MGLITVDKESSSKQRTIKQAQEERLGRRGSVYYRVEGVAHGGILRECGGWVLGSVAAVLLDVVDTP